MKIIGQTADGLLLSATKEEVARLAGYYWPGDEQLRKAGIRLEPGAEIAVSTIYSRLRSLASASAELEAAAKTLRAIADLLGPVRRVIEMTAPAEAKK